MHTYGEKLLLSYLKDKNETLRDIGADVESIREILDCLEQLHKVFLEMLLEAQGPEAFLLSDDDV